MKGRTTWFLTPQRAVESARRAGVFAAGLLILAGGAQVAGARTIEAQAAAANLVRDGNFPAIDAGAGQAGAAQGQGYFTDYCAAKGTNPDCPTAAPDIGVGWVVTSGSVDVNLPGEVAPPATATAGSQMLDLDGWAPGAIKQTLKTRKGDSYDGSFLLSTNADGTSGASANPVKHMKLVIGGHTIGHYAIRVGDSRVIKFKFKAKSSATVLSFASTDNKHSANGAAITDIYVVK